MVPWAVLMDSIMLFHGPQRVGARTTPGPLHGARARQAAARNEHGTGVPATVLTLTRDRQHRRSRSVGGPHERGTSAGRSGEPHLGEVYAVVVLRWKARLREEPVVDDECVQAGRIKESEGVVDAVHPLA